MTGTVFFPPPNNLVFLSDFLANRRPQGWTGEPTALDAGPPVSLASLLRGEFCPGASATSQVAHVVRDISWRFDGKSAEVARVFRKLPPKELEDNRSALRRLRHLVAHAHPDTAQGTYAGFLSLCLVGEIARLGSSGALRTLLRFLGDGGTLASYERFVASIMPPLAAVASPAPFRPMADAELQDALDGARGLSAASPLAFLRFFRMRQILSETRDAALRLSKLRELGDRSLRLIGDEPLPERFGAHAAWTQHDAYLGERRALVSLYAMDQLRSGDAREASGRRRAALSSILGGRPPREVTPQDAARAFEALGDALSRRVSASLRLGRVSLRFTDGADVADDASNPRGSVPILQARRFPVGPGRSLKGEDVFFEILAGIVRRFRVQEDRLVSRAKAEAWNLEYAALLSEAVWRGVHGDRTLVTSAFDDAPLGPALYFRDRLEAFNLSSKTSK